MYPRSKYWWTPEEKGLTPEEIDAKCEELWQEDLKTATKHCHDCNAAPGEVHMNGCDTARCMTCGGQALSCGCEDTDEKWSNKWDGLWPGTKECYEQKLITWAADIGWMFNYNELARRRQCGNG